MKMKQKLRYSSPYRSSNAVCTPPINSNVATTNTLDLVKAYENEDYYETKSDGLFRR